MILFAGQLAVVDALAVVINQRAVFGDKRYLIFDLREERDGGSGACYVALKKSAEAKQENWERHAKRSR